MKRKTSLLALLSAGAVTVLVVAGFSQAAGSPPSNQSPPTISGTPVDGNTLTAHGGTWTNSPTSTSFQWRRCDQNGASCSSISGATGSTYALKQVDVGNTLRVRETATNSAGSATSTSVPTAVVKAAPQPPPTTLNGCPTSGSGTLAVSAVSPPARLVIDGQAASPSVITRSTEDVTLRFHVAACNGRDVQGALVYATAVPFQQFGVPAEATTDSSGWATITLHRAGHFPASAHQQLLAVFVRARKTGESLLGGISTRRLVSFPVQL
jgi:Ig domain of plant-specific actin-binding protein